MQLAHDEIGDVGARDRREAAQLADLVWPTLVLAGIESFSIRPGITAVTPLDFTRYPYSHSLAGMALWGAGLGLTYFIFRRRLLFALLLFAVVVSHWLLDFVSHRPDLPLTLVGAERFGLGLWHSRMATVAVEGLLFAVCVWIYVRSTRPIDRTGTWSLVSLVALLVVIYLANIFGPAPPSVAAVTWTAQAIWLLVAWGYWIDRHRN